MRNVKFSEAGEPIIIGVLKEATADATIETIKSSEKEGANAFDLHLSLLEGENREPKALERIFGEADSPILAVHYNNLPKNITTKNTSEERVAEMIRAVECGAAGIDMQGYTFCKDSRATLAAYSGAKKYPFIAANPKEVVLDHEIIEKQKRAIDEVHKRGGEVLMSCHTGVFLDTEQIVSLALEMESRGPDIIKIVTPCETKEQILIALNSVMELRSNLHAKFQYHCSGRLGRITRYIAPYFGSAIVFATDHYNERADKEQLLIKKFNDFYNEIKPLEQK